MKITSHKIDISEVKNEIKNHFSALPSKVDSFYEDHLIESDFYRLLADGKPAGVVAVHKESMIIMFIVSKEFKRYGQELFYEARRLSEVTCAYVPTCDEFYLSVALEASKKMEFQAYFFKETENTVKFTKEEAVFSLEKATKKDIEKIIEDTDDFFNPLESHIENGRVYKGMVDGNSVSYGIIEESRIFDDVSSIGMIVVDCQRQKGYGALTLKSLRNICHQNNITPIAGCWYYNHLSKKTLQNAGFYSDTRMLKIHF
ncbi:hypothetical protein J2Z35_002357 [Acetoanaerobium pronyense]|uniref:Acetyltransferase (GNAT) domain-containing protein n=1 Tax=Acetoanaerobium pronyense TaxID=1482736 RepID=A0ABS4KN08_9FIRM|nr:hypothetical protein [Acetoanaerobium pronyense]MBP2028531.1 hypothetical protein [Acetoanaerobium pronyense]